MLHRKCFSRPSENAAIDLGGSRTQERKTEHESKSRLSLLFMGIRVTKTLRGHFFKYHPITHGCIRGVRNGRAGILSPWVCL